MINIATTAEKSTGTTDATAYINVRKSRRLHEALLLAMA
jgi:hypothetical protein